MFQAGMNEAETHVLVVREAREEVPLVRRLLLESLAPPFPPHAAGAHLRVRLPEGGDRAYSLVDLPAERAAGRLVLGVRQEEGGLGSAHLHRLGPGDQLLATGPVNRFPLGDEDEAPLLVAGGIGVTPLLSMAVALGARDYRLHLAARGREHAPFLAELREIAGERLVLHAPDAPAGRLDPARLLAEHGPDTPLYLCGPSRLEAAVRAEALARGWPEALVRSESFLPAAAAAGGERAFEVEVASTGRVFPVPVGISILEALERGGFEAMHDCRRGDCGVCRCDVLSGVPDHRDAVLGPAERASGRVMHPCVSRSLSDRLVLDL